MVGGTKAMTPEVVLQKIKQGESNQQKFKRCGGNIEKDILETVCSFLNRFGGDIMLGVLDNGSICGVPEKSAENLMRNLTNLCNDPKLFDPVCVVTCEAVVIEGKTIIVVNVPPSSTVHSFKGKVYDRSGDVDIVIKNDAIAQAFIRKKDIFTERKVFPYLRVEHLNPTIIERARRLAVINNNSHPWKDMTHDQMMRSAGLYLHDYENDKDGLTLAAGLLFGRDDVIQDLCPTYWTDCLCRKVNTIRYDDREIVRTNLIDSVDLIMDFARKHTNDKFYLDDLGHRVSLRSSISREIIVNCLIHREFTSSIISRFIIEKDRMYTENPTKAQYPGEITPDILEPRPRNPLIARVFREITYSDQLGSGMRKLYRDVPLYSGIKERPQFLDGDIFRLVVPMDDIIPAAGESGQESSPNGSPNSGQKTEIIGEKDNIFREKRENIREKTWEKIISIIKSNPKVSTNELAQIIGISAKGIEYQLQQLKNKNLIRRVGPDKGGHWELIQSIREKTENIGEKNEIIREKTENIREKTWEIIISAMKLNPQISTIELAQLTNVSVKNIEYHLQRLKSKSLIRRIGPDNGGHWEVINQN